jgi:predicted anti-sigma-YlaC factor YlaD
MNDDKTTMCNEIELLLPEYLKGGLAEENSRKIEKHLESCSECSLILDSTRSFA